MKNQVILAFMLTYNLHATDEIYGLSLDDIACQKQGADIFTKLDDKTVTDFCIQKGNYIDGTLTVVFLYEWEGKFYKEILNAPLTAEPLDLSLPNFPYDPKQNLKDYLDGLNKLSLKANNKIVWNADKKVTLENGNCWAPIVYFIDTGNVEFYNWGLIVDKETNQSKIHVTYGFQGVKPIGKMEIYRLEHSSKLSQEPTTFTCDRDYQLREVNAVTWSTIPDSKKPWAISNGIENEDYTSLDYSRSIGKILDHSQKLVGSSFNLTFKKYLPSKYVFCEGNEHYFLTQVKEYRVIAKKEFPLQTLRILHETSYPLVLSTEKGVTLSPSSFQKGFYCLRSSKDMNGVIQEVWSRDEAAQSTIEYISQKGDSAFATTDLTHTLLRINDTDLHSLVESIRNFQPWCKTGRIKTLKMRIANLQLDEKKKVTDRLWQIRKFLLSNVHQEILKLDCDEIHFGESSLSNADLLYLKSHNIAKDHVSGSKKIEFSVRPTNDVTQSFLFDSWNALMEFPNLKPAILDLSGLGAKILLGNNLKEYVQRNENLTDLNLIDTQVWNLNHVYEALANATQLKKIHLNQFNSHSLQPSHDCSKWVDRDDIKRFVYKLRSLNSLSVPGLEKGLGFYICGGLEGNKQSLKYLDVSDAKCLYEYGNRFISAISGLKNLVDLNVLNTDLSNSQTRDLIISLRKLNTLKTLKITMPYWGSESIVHLELIADTFRKANSVTDYASMALMGALFPVGTFFSLVDDITGECNQYKYTCYDLALIPYLSNLTLQIWGIRKYTEWTRQTINDLRFSKEMTEIKINFVD